MLDRNSATRLKCSALALVFAAAALTAGATTAAGAAPLSGSGMAVSRT